MPKLTDRQQKAKAVMAALLRSARQTWTAESSRVDPVTGVRKIYTQIREPNNKLSCDCPAWVNKVNRQRWCKHLTRASFAGGFEVYQDGEFFYAKDK